MKKNLLLLIAGLLSVSISMNSLTLQQSIEMAKTNNKDLRTAKEDIIIADQTYSEVRGMLLPQISLQGGYQLSNTWLPDSANPGRVDFTGSLDEYASSNDSTLAEVLSGVVNAMVPASPIKEGSLACQLKLEQILFSGGKLINGLKAVKKYRSIQRLRYNLLEQTIILQTTDMFYQTILAQKVYDIQQEALQTATRHLERVELFYSEGQVSEYDLLRARLEVAKLRPGVVKAFNNYDLAMSAFKKQIGFKDEILRLDGEFVLPVIEEMDLEAALQAAEKNRIELKLTSINTEISQIRYNAEKGNYLPVMGLTAGYSIYSKADAYKIEKDDFGKSLSLGIGFSIPIFTGLSNTAKRINAKHSYYKARISENDATELIALEVRQTRQNLHTSMENYLVQTENIKLAEKSVRLAQVRYENQVGIQLEVFDAQLNLNAVKLSYLNSIYEVISSHKKFLKAIGYNS